MVSYKYDQKNDVSKQKSLSLPDDNGENKTSRHYPPDLPHDNAVKKNSPSQPHTLSHDNDGKYSDLNLKDLCILSRRVDDELAMLLMDDAPLSVILKTLSEKHEALTRSVIMASEQEMADEGMGYPPLTYCWINMGSAARHEQTLRSDQDNAMIYADPEQKKDDTPDKKREVDRYFELLSKKIVNGLNSCGFALCRGDVMATNPKWRKSLTSWMESLENWSGSFDPEDTRSMTIFLDFRPVWGDFTLAEKLWEKIVHHCNESDMITHMLADDELKNSNPITLLGRIRTKRSGPFKDQVNLKTAGLVHIVNALRIYALKHNIKEASTLGRIEQLSSKKVISTEETTVLTSAFETLTMLRLTTNIRKIREDSLPDDFVYPSRLTPSQRASLKDALSSVHGIQKMLSRDFTLPWINFFS
ncbi:conserved hypothetical protein [Desulfamplus magnetovallimortis]|uniref:Uncharacterized protein n=1 Tax=Desulfamplus magnetovallimortis TaxID=1246637 RepID=A0A1W1HGD8_9BACT|nr:DUF294 nucleotidyltransferase-like domain-containing protein [Desulfamplus magnetovallimortis]SLM31506.1 conserved hypothetical protein [Desulfamplus magnetovallimortis]